MIPGPRNEFPVAEVAYFQEGPGLRSWQWSTEGMKVVNGTNILSDGVVDTSNTDRYITLSEFEGHYSHFAIEEGDIVVSSSGTIGKVGRIRREHLPLMMNTSVVRFHSRDTQVLDNDYLFAFLRSSEFQNQVASLVVGGVQQNFGPAHIKKMTICLPSISEQRRTADILSAYDDLIENNRRRMVLLEVAARQLYREWFVRLRFPGHEHTPIRDGVPEGWERRQLGEVATLNYGKALKSESRFEGSVPVYGSSGVVGVHSEALVNGPGIVVGRKGNVGSVYWIDRAFWPIDTVYFIAPNESNLYLYYCLMNVPFQSSDVAVPGLNRTYAQGMKILVPTQRIRAYFDDFVASLFAQMATLRSMNEKLRAARDLLLPRLMSGEISA